MKAASILFLSCTLVYSLSAEETSLLLVEEPQVSYEELMQLFDEQKPAPAATKKIEEKQEYLIVVEEQPEPKIEQEQQPVVARPAPKQTHHKRWLADAEFLYWKVNKGNTYYAIKRENLFPMDVNNSDSEIVGNILGEMERPDMDLTPGVRASLGYRFDRDAWELSAAYTYYKTSKSNHESIKFPGGDDQLFETPNVIVPAFDIVLHGYASDVFSKIKFGYMIEDLRLARLFKLTPYIDLRFYFGLQGAQISQKWDVDFAFLQNPTFAKILDKNKLNWSFKGLGGNIGFDTSWRFWRGLGFLTKASFSALYGIHKTRLLGESNNNNFETDPGHFDLIADSRAIDHRPIYAAQFAFGLSWAQNFNRVNAKIFACYESITWWNLNGDIFTQSFPGNPTANLDGPNASHAPIVNDTPFNLSGLTAGVLFEF
ncbi:MAG: hypothetical protein HYX48_05045 [Chlamydiales bacterium]|nr:hypothetical protein [Chlamydiales bacterium]